MFDFGKRLCVRISYRVSKPIEASNCLCAIKGLVSGRYTVEIAKRQGGFKPVLLVQAETAFHLRHDLFNSDGFRVFHDQAKWTYGNIR